MRVLTWNLFHGRSVPDTPRSLLPEFAERLATWEWDVALLQEVPPWWPPALGRAARASARTALTSRSWLLPLRRFVADRRPDLIKSNGGGANAILVRRQPILDHRRRRLRRCPERRVVHAVRLAGGPWVVNLHGQAHWDRLARADLARAAATTLEWAARAPAILGGDVNLLRPRADGFVHAGGHGVDHVFVRHLRPGASRRLERGRLSDHVPVVVDVEAAE